MIRVGVDIGGTFTDLQFFFEDGGAVREYKTSTTPDDPSEGLLAGLKGGSAAFGFDLSEVGLILHGTTIATNAVLENKLAKGGLLTTAGFEDVLEIGRHLRRDVFGLHAEKRRLLIPRHLRKGIAERVGADGAVIEALDEDSVRAAVAALMAEGVVTIAVSLINSFRHPLHEQRVGAIIREMAPGMAVSLSSEVCPEIREYERTSTTVLNALLMPVVKGYMEKLERRLGTEAPEARVLLMQSNGGAGSLRTTAENPARLLLSGPSGGSLSLEHLARVTGMGNLVGMDIGGTSCDIAVVSDGRAAMVSKGSVDGCTVQLPMIDIRTIGAGGGSIAWIDDTGSLRVGPESAGAVPGPVAYGRGGRRPTVTDANVVLARMAPDQFMKGTIGLNVAAAETAIAEAVGTPLGLPIPQAAEGIVTIMVNSMVTAIRLSLFERGLDPEDFALVSFGGAGGLHASLVARELGVRRIVYPRNASTLSAFGFLWSDITHDIARSHQLDMGPGAAKTIGGIVAALRAEGNALLARDGIDPERRRFGVSLDLRYRGQGFELTVPVAGDAAKAADLEAAVADFHALHQQLFSHANPDEAVELLTIRLSAIGALPKPAIAAEAHAAQGAAEGRRRVFCDGAWRELPVVWRDDLAPGRRVSGPAIIDEGYTTIFLSAGWTISTGAAGELIATAD